MLCVTRAQSHNQYTTHCLQRQRIKHIAFKKRKKPFEGLYYVIKKDRVIINATENLKARTPSPLPPPPSKQGQCSQMLLFNLGLFALCFFFISTCGGKCKRYPMFSTQIRRFRADLVLSTQTRYFQPQSVFFTDLETPYPGIPACVSHLAAYQLNTGPERDLGHGSLLMGMTGWKKMTAMKNIRSKLTANNFFAI